MGFLTSAAAIAGDVQQLLLLPPMRLLAVLLVAALICVPAALGITVAPVPHATGSNGTASATATAGGLLTNEADRTLALNQTERFRRLIPYMTFYVPGGQSASSSATAGDYLPINQAYSYAPANQPNPGQAHQQQQQEVQQQQPLHLDDDADQHIIQQAHGQHAQQQQQQQHYHHHAHPARGHPYGASGTSQHHAPPSSSLPAAAKAHGPQLVYVVRPQPPQHATIVYKTRHQAHKPHKPQQQPPQQQQHQSDVNDQPQRINYSYQYLPQSPSPLPKKKLTPFLSTNQIPGEFRPVPQQIDEFEQQQQQPQHQQPAYNEYSEPAAIYSPMAETDSDLPPPASHQVFTGQHKPTNDASTSNQLYYHQPQPHQSHRQHQANNNYAHYRPQSSSPATPSYMQFIKAVSPGHQHQQHQPPTTVTASPPPQPLDIPAEAMPLLHSPHLMLPPMSHQAFGSPADQAASIGYHHHHPDDNKVQYNGFDYGSYTLDPDDGYERRVPTAPPPPAARQNHQQQQHQQSVIDGSPVIAKGTYGGFSYRTTTATPFVVSPTPFRPKPAAQPKYAYGQKLPVARPTPVAPPPSGDGDVDDAPTPPAAQFSFDRLPQTQTQRPFEHQPLSYEHIRPSQQHQQRPTAVPATDVRQHLTETTHIDRPPVRPYHAQHRQPPQRQYQHYHQHAAATTAATPPPLLLPAVPTRIVVPDIELPDDNASPDYAASAESDGARYADVLHKLQQSNLLPHRLNDGNIDGSIKSLVEILNTLKQRQQQQQQQHQRRPLPAYANEVSPPPEIVVPEARRPYSAAGRRPTRPRTTTTERPQPVEDNGDYDYNGGGGGSGSDGEDTRSSEDHHAGPPGPHTGRPGIDYPALAEIPPTAFNCKEQRYKGFFGDPETNCQVWHYCDLNGGQASFLCPNGTIFSQVALTCDWWFNVKCSTTTQLYVLNERLYKYILPFSPKFPEDYSGPVVDKYLAMKFAEMEEKMRREKDKSKHTGGDDDTADEHNENDIDAPATSTEYDHHQIGADAQAAALLAATGGGGDTAGNGAQIDEEGQSHNVDSAIQYVDEGDTVRVPRPSLPYHSRSLTAAHLIAPEVHNNNHIEATSGDYEAINDAAELTSTELVLASSSTGASTDSAEPSTLSPPRTTMEPPLRDTIAGGGGGGSTVVVESERVELIEIKSDGSTGHLTPDGYR